jgi:hypothetical protein
MLVGQRFFALEKGVAPKSKSEHQVIDQENFDVVSFGAETVDNRGPDVVSSSVCTVGM